jgi:hypothetical protein
MTTIMQEAAMQDDLEQRVAAIIRDMRLASYDDQARAIIPMVLEHAAKVADNEAAAWVNDNEGSHGARQASGYIAAAIRAIGAKP